MMRTVGIVPFLVALAHAPASAGGCAADWQPGFGGAPGTVGAVFAQAVFGGDLYVGGAFDHAGGAYCAGIARFDGEEWAPMGTGLAPTTFGDEAIHAMAVYDYGVGPALYVAGRFDSIDGVAVGGIARWDGAQWSPVAGGITGRVDALRVFDDGGGPALFAAGEFSSAGGLPVSNVARWAGLSWSPVGAGLGADVHALAVHDDGSGGGPQLWAGGTFQDLGGLPGAWLAKWTGTTWTSSSPAVTTTSPTDPPAIRALVSYDDGGGPALYVGGQFDAVNGVAANGVARLKGGTWSAMASGTGPVRALTVYAGPGGPALIVGREEGGGPGVLRWTGSAWVPLGEHTGGAFSLLPHAPGGGPAVLHAAGQISTIEGRPAFNVAVWDGAAWSLPGGGLDGPVAAVAAFDAGAGPELVAAGDFRTADGQPVNGVARYAGGAWSSLAGGLGAPAPAVPSARALAVFDDGSGPALFVGGKFTSAGGTPVQSIARWDGASWSPVGTGTSGIVETLVVHDDGSGAALYAGGTFQSIGGVLSPNAAKWDGVAWTPLGAGLDDDVLELVSHDDGGGPALYAGGRFKNAGGAPASHVARWDGSTWSPVGAGAAHSSGFGYVRGLAVHAFSGAPELVAGGFFNAAGGAPAANVARWNGASWSPAGSGLNSVVLSLDSFDLGDGGGPRLLAAGAFFSASGGPNRVAEWGGTDWLGLPGPLSGTFSMVEGLGAASGRPPAFHVGGTILVSPEADSFLATYGCPAPTVEVVPGCQPKLATLTPLASSVQVGNPFSCRIDSAIAGPGTGFLYVGVDGTDQSGCGVPIGIGELLLRTLPPPFLLLSSPYAGGQAPFTFGVPPLPPLAGVPFQMQGVLAAPAETRLTTALHAVVQP